MALAVATLVDGRPIPSCPARRRERAVCFAVEFQSPVPGRTPRTASNGRLGVIGVAEEEFRVVSDFFGQEPDQGGDLGILFLQLPRENNLPFRNGRGKRILPQHGYGDWRGNRRRARLTLLSEAPFK